MPRQFFCVRCGWTEEEHDRNLVNIPAEGDFAHIETPIDGCSLSILECMETELPEDYKRKLRDLNLSLAAQQDQEHGYQSPDPEAEERAMERSQIVHYGSSNFLVLPGGRGIIDLD